MVNGRNVLVVDDNDELREFMVLSLRNAGFQVTEAVDGKEALRMLQDGSYALMVLDAMMPRMSGLEVLQSLEQTPEKAPSTLVVSQLPHIEATLSRFNLERIGFLSKPFESAALIEKVRSMLS